jgi:hypothetical protein
MTLRTARRLIAVGTGLIMWSVLFLAGMHGGLLLSEVTR